MNYEKTEAMLTEELNLRYFYYWILRKRAVIFAMLFLGPVDIIYSVIKGKELSFYQYLMMLLSPLIIFSILALLIYFAEKYFIKDFPSLDEKMKYRKLRIIWILENWFFLSAIMAVARLSNYASHSFVYVTVTESFIVIPAITLFVILIFSYFQFNSLKLEIEEKGLFDKLKMSNIK